MKKFITRVSLFVVLLAGIYATVHTLVPEWRRSYRGFAIDYMQGIRTKHKRANEIQGPKLIFVGGSNLAYSLDSQMIQDSLSVPVVNMGLHGGLGLEHILGEANLVANPGDIVFCCIEYYLGEGDYRLLKETCSEFEEVASLMPYSLKQEAMEHFDKTRENIKVYLNAPDKPRKPKIVFSDAEFQHLLETGYSPLFSPLGDYTAHLNSEGWFKRKPDELKFQYRYWQGIDQLNEFYAEAREKGINVYFSFAPFSKSAFVAQSNTIERLYQDLINDLDIEMLNTPEELMFEDHLFYDSEAHLIREGRQIRTEDLIRAIRKSPHANRSVQLASQHRPD